MQTGTLNADTAANAASQLNSDTAFSITRTTSTKVKASAATSPQASSLTSSAPLSSPSSSLSSTSGILSSADASNWVPAAKTQPTSTPETGSSPSPDSATSTAQRAPTAATPSALSMSAKIGIGLGVPLGVVILTLMVALLFWKRRKRNRSPRLSHLGKPNTGAGSYALNEDQKTEAATGKDARSSNTQAHTSGISSADLRASILSDPPTVSSLGPSEVHGDDIPPYSRELMGSPGVLVYELPGS